MYKSKEATQFSISGGKLLYQQLKKQSLPFLVVGLLILVAVTIALVTDEQNTVFVITSILVALVAFLMSAVGLKLFAREGLVSEDRFHMLHTNIAIALLFFAIAEAIGAAVQVLPSPESYQIALGLIQTIGILLWVEGTIFYLSAANTVLEFSDKRLILPLVLTLSTLPYIFVQLFLILSSGAAGSHLLVTIPLEIGLTVILISESIILWHYRDGYFALPILLSLFGTLSLLTRTVLWSSSGTTLGIPELQMLGIIGYWLIGFSLFLIRKGEDMIETV